MLNELTNSLNIIVSHTHDNLPAIKYIIIVLWGVFWVNLLLGRRLLWLGIQPRCWLSLPGILFAPLLHVNFSHLFFNTIPLIVLSNFLLINGINYFIYATGFIILLSGMLIWCFGRPGIHVGASAVVTGYWGLLVLNSVNNSSLTTIILAAICLYYFAGIFFGIFPAKKGVSWDGHLFGLISGLITSYLMTSIYFRVPCFPFF